MGLVVLAATGPATAASAQASAAAPSFNGTVHTVAYAGDIAYLGGDFTTAIVRGKPVARAHLAAIDARTGELLSWAPVADGRVKALAVAGDSVYLAGDFRTVGGQKRDSLARVDAATGTLSSTFKHSINGKPYALAISGRRLYLGGAITAVDGQARGRLAAFNLSTGALDKRWRPTVDAAVDALAAGAGRIYVGGRFRKINKLAGYERLAALDPGTAAVVPDFHPRPTVITYGLAVTEDGVYSAHGGHGGTVSAYTLAGTPRWSATFDGDAQAVTVLNGTVYAGGHFDRACATIRTGPQGACLDGSVDRVKVAAFAEADGHLLDWTANANGILGVFALATNPTLGRLAMGGAFTVVDGQSQKRFAQFEVS
jgi:hypothetical protein